MTLLFEISDVFTKLGIFTAIKIFKCIKLQINFLDNSLRILKEVSILKH
jgi:hypothetical protein